MAKVYKKDLEVFLTHKDENGEDVLYPGQIILQQLLDFLDLNAHALSKKLGWDRPDALYRIVEGKTKKISAGMAMEIHNVFPEVSMVWLLTGNPPIESKKEAVIKDGLGQKANSGVSSSASGSAQKPVLLPLDEHQKTLLRKIEQMQKSVDDLKKDTGKILLHLAQNKTGGTGGKKGKASERE